MAVLYGVTAAAAQKAAAPDADTVPAPPLTHLQSEHELDARGRTNLEMIRLWSLLERLNGAGSPYEGKFQPDPKPVFQAWWDLAQPPSAAPGDDTYQGRVKALNEALPAFNLSVLSELAKCGLEVELGYETGLSLRDSADPPACEPATAGTADPGPADAKDGADALVARIRESLNRDRVAIIQEGLTILAPHFPDNAAKIVSSSLGRWSDLAQVTLVDTAPGKLRGDSEAKKQAFAKTMQPLLLRQGDAWLALLVGEESTSNLLSPEAYVAAGDAALRRTGRIIAKVVWRYKWALLILLAALAAALTGAALYVGGASKVWTSIAAFAGTVGITWKGIATGIPKLAGDAERPIFGLEEVEAMAWSITTLPEATMNSTGVSYMRASGAGPPAPLGSV
jgi:hypothetical protein